jgi:hypothetical protein
MLREVHSLILKLSKRLIEDRSFSLWINPEFLPPGLDVIEKVLQKHHGELAILFCLHSDFPKNVLPAIEISRSFSMTSHDGQSPH